MTERFVLRPDRNGFTIQDVLTGQPASIAGTRQSGLSEQDASHTAKLLNQRAMQTQGALQ
jgi:hypothetical protein